jgi:hypothetical protein
MATATTPSTIESSERTNQKQIPELIAAPSALPSSPDLSKEELQQFFAHEYWKLQQFYRELAGWHSALLHQHNVLGASKQQQSFATPSRRGGRKGHQQ